MAAEPGHQVSVPEHGEDELTPQDWGWHHEFGKARQIMGWFSVIVLTLYLTTTHYNLAGFLPIILIIVGLVGGLLWDRKRRSRQWRS